MVCWYSCFIQSNYDSKRYYFLTISSIFLLGYFCIAGECISVNEKHKNVHDCQVNGTYLKAMLDEQNIKKYLFVCLDASEKKNI